MKQVFRFYRGEEGLYYEADEPHHSISTIIVEDAIVWEAPKRRVHPEREGSAFVQEVVVDEEEFDLYVFGLAGRASYIERLGHDVARLYPATYED